MTKALLKLLRRIMCLGALAVVSTAVVGATPPSEPAPELSLSLRGLAGDLWEQGEPLRVVVRLESSGEGTGRVELVPSTGTWVDAVTVELLAPGSNTPVARASPVGVPDSPRATLDRDHVAGGLWMFASGSTQGLAPGDYVVRVRLSIRGGAGWLGEVSSDEVPLRIVGVSSAPERVSARALARAEIAFSAKNFEGAARLLDDVLAKSPDDFALLCLRADVALSGGNSLAAMMCVNRAAQQRPPKTSGPPPLMLHEVQARVYAARLSASSSVNPPNWTWPPASMLALPETDTAVASGAARSSVAAAAVANVPVSSATPAAPLPAQISTAVSPGVVVPIAELNDVKIAADAAGQWAASAKAGSQYGTTQYSAAQATGAPNISVQGNSPDAWCPATRTGGIDWLEVTFAKPVHATEVRVRQNDAAGAIVKIEAIEPNGTSHVWWEGVDPYKAPPVREIVWFGVRVPKTDYLVAKVKITLNLASGPGYKEIDAVQLVGVVQ